MDTEVTLAQKLREGTVDGNASRFSEAVSSILDILMLKDIREEP